MSGICNIGSWGGVERACGFKDNEFNCSECQLASNMMRLLGPQHSSLIEDWTISRVGKDLVLRAIFKEDPNVYIFSIRKGVYEAEGPSMPV